jgi:hypothetical protein
VEVILAQFRYRPYFLFHAIYLIRAIPDGGKEGKPCFQLLK